MYANFQSSRAPKMGYIMTESARFLCELNVGEGEFSLKKKTDRLRTAVRVMMEQL